MGNHHSLALAVPPRHRARVLRLLRFLRVVRSWLTWRVCGTCFGILAFLTWILRRRIAAFLLDFFPHLPEFKRDRLLPIVQAKAQGLDQPRFGRGLPDFRCNEWRPYLLPDRPPREMLQELIDCVEPGGRFHDHHRGSLVQMLEETGSAPGPAGIAGISRDDLIEAVRLVMFIKDPLLPSRTEQYWCEDQCEDILDSLLLDCGWPNAWSVMQHKDIPAPVVLMKPHPPIVTATLTGFFVGTRIVLNAFGLSSCYYTTRRGARIHYYDSGPPANMPTDTPPLVLVHGIGVNGSSMGLVGMALRHRCRVIIPDLVDWDFGYSRSVDGQADETQQVDSIVEVINNLDLRASGNRVHLCGHSHGGHLSVLVSARCERVCKLVLLCPSGTLCNRSCRLMAHWWVRRRILMTRIGGPAFLRLFITSLITWCIRSVQTCNAVFGETWDTYHNVPPLRVDTLVMWGTRDEIVAPRASPTTISSLNKPLTRVSRGHTLTKLLPTQPGIKCEGVWVHGATHALVCDAAHSVATHLGRFLDLPDVHRKPMLLSSFLQTLQRITALPTSTMGRADETSSKVRQRLLAARSCSNNSIGRSISAPCLPEMMQTNLPQRDVNDGDGDSTTELHDTAANVAVATHNMTRQ